MTRLPHVRDQDGDDVTTGRYPVLIAHRGVPPGSGLGHVRWGLNRRTPGSTVSAASGSESPHPTRPRGHRLRNLANRLLPTSHSSARWISRA